MAIAFFIMFLVILALLIYLIYDYITYKQEVDNTVTIIKNAINSSNLTIQSKYNDAISSIGSMTSNITLNRDDIIDYDTAFGKFFQITSNGQPLKDKIYDATFYEDPTNTKYRMNMLKHINATQGMSINIDNNAFRLCSNNACINVGMRDSKFNITPANDSDNILEINSYNNIGKPLASIDFKNKNMYFAGNSESSSPMYIKGENVYIDETKFNLKNSKSTMGEFIGKIASGKVALNTALLDMNAAIFAANSNLEFVGQCTLTNTQNANPPNAPAGTVATYTNTLKVEIYPLQDIEFGAFNTVEIPIPTTIGTIQSVPTPSSPIGITSVAKHSTNNSLVATITATNITKLTPLGFTISGVTMLSGGKSTVTTTTTEFIIPKRINYPPSYLPNVSRNSINNWYNPPAPAPATVPSTSQP